MTIEAVVASRVLVTGANGRLGRRVVARLSAMPACEVVALGGESSTSGRIDLADSDAIRRVVRDTRPTAIVHLGARVGASCDRDPASAERVNVDGTGVLAEALSGRPATRFVFASTAAVYGDAQAGPLPESTVCAPSTVYGRQKLRAECLLSQVAEASDERLTAVTLRIFNVFGPSFDASLVERLRHSTPESPVDLRGMDEFIRDYVHVDDVVDAIALSLSVGLGSSSVINIGSGVGLSSRQLVERLSRVAPVFFTGSDGRPSSSIADIGRARRLLGFDARSSSELSS